MNAVRAGAPIRAVNGYRSLRATGHYYFLCSSPRSQLVSLVEFRYWRRPSDVSDGSAPGSDTLSGEPRALLIRMPRGDFEEGLARGLLQAGPVEQLPPWLKALEGKALPQAQEGTSELAQSHAKRIADKLGVIESLVSRAAELLDADDFEQQVNRHARTQVPPRNETRVRTWLLTYLVFARNPMALHYATGRIGRWSRLTHPSPVKRGAPGRAGKSHGFNTSQAMHDLIIKGYGRAASLGVKRREIYKNVMREEFGCKARKDPSGEFVLYHPTGQPFPTREIFFYHVREHHGTLTIQTTRMGANRARNKVRPELGSFSQHTWNLMQRTEADAYWVRDLPKGYTQALEIAPLVVVTMRCTASGRIVGIGFELGREKAQAYRCARFCAAVGFTEFGRLFGYEVPVEVGAPCGLPLVEVTDRGPGATERAHPSGHDLIPFTSQVSPSYAGQGKAIIETSHPKNSSDDEAPSFRKSGMTVDVLARRELARVLEFNDTANVHSRVDPSLAELVGPISTPNAVWRAKERLGRHDGLSIRFEQAVRSNLKRVTGSLSRSGLTLAGRNYYSKESLFQDAMAAAASRALEVQVHVLTVCVRYVWLEWKGKLMELDVRYPIPVPEGVLYMTLQDARRYEEATKDQNTRLDKNRDAAGVAYDEDFEAQTGQKRTATKRVPGRPGNRKAAAKEESKGVGKSLAGKNRA